MAKVEGLLMGHIIKNYLNFNFFLYVEFQTKLRKLKIGKNNYII